MEHIIFIGLGHMGFPMMENLLKAGYKVTAFDIVTDLKEKAKKIGASTSDTIAACVQDADVIITMLPAGEHVKSVYSQILKNGKKSTLLCDCSTIDIDTAKDLHEQAQKHGFEMLDAPVSGGTAGAKAGTLTFMVGGSEASFSKIQTILQKMGKKVFYAGTAGMGQAAKICNNLMLAIHMIGTAEGFTLGEKLGLDLKVLHEICNSASGQSWSLTNYCPAKDVLPNVPSARDYEPGFMVNMMLKDLRLAESAAASVKASLPLGLQALTLYDVFSRLGYGEKDFSYIISLIDGRLPSASQGIN